MFLSRFDVNRQFNGCIEGGIGRSQLQTAVRNVTDTTPAGITRFKDLMEQGLSGLELSKLSF